MEPTQAKPVKDNTKAPDGPRSMPWPLKLIFTVLVGGPLSCWTFWRFSSFYNDPFRWAFAGHILTVVFWTVVVATSLYLTETNGWLKAARKGFPLALIASLLVTALLGSLFLIGTMVVSRMIH